MMREIIKIDLDQIAEIEEHHREVEVSMDKIIGVDCKGEEWLVRLFPVVRVQTAVLPQVLPL